MWKYVVIQIAYTQQNNEQPLFAGLIYSCWNIVYSSPIEYMNTDCSHPDAFTACQAWLENNKAPGSQYIITSMFFVE